MRAPGIVHWSAHPAVRGQLSAIPRDDMERLVLAEQRDAGGRPRQRGGRLPDLLMLLERPSPGDEGPAGR